MPKPNAVISHIANAEYGVCTLEDKTSSWTTLSLSEIRKRSDNKELEITNTQCVVAYCSSLEKKIEIYGILEWNKVIDWSTVDAVHEAINEFELSRCKIRPKPISEALECAKTYAVEGIDTYRDEVIAFINEYFAVGDKWIIKLPIALPKKLFDSSATDEEKKIRSMVLRQVARLFKMAGYSVKSEEDKVYANSNFFSVPDHEIKIPKEKRVEIFEVIKRKTDSNIKYD